MAKTGVNVSLADVLEAERKVTRLLNNREPFSTQTRGQPIKRPEDKKPPKLRKKDKGNIVDLAEKCDAEPVNDEETSAVSLLNKPPILAVTENTVTIDRKSFFAQFADMKRYGFSDTAVLKYPSPDALALDVDMYFRMCDEKNVTPRGEYRLICPYTWSGLCAHLGLAKCTVIKISKMFNYDIVLDLAKTRIEAHLLEQALMNRVQPIVALKTLAHQHEWKENQELTVAMKNITFTGEDQLKD